MRNRYVPYDWNDSINEGGPDPAIERLVLSDGSELLRTANVEVYDSLAMASSEESAAGPLTLCLMFLHEAGLDVASIQVLEDMEARGLRYTYSEERSELGMSLEDLRELFNDYGVKARWEMGCSLEDLAQVVEAGGNPLVHINQGIVLNTTAGFDNGDANRLVMACGVVRYPQTREIQSFELWNGRGLTESLTASASRMELGWLCAGGLYMSPP